VRRNGITEENSAGAVENVQVQSKRRNLKILTSFKTNLKMRKDSSANNDASANQTKNLIPPRIDLASLNPVPSDYKLKFEADYVLQVSQITFL